MSDNAKLAGFLQAQIIELTGRRNDAIAKAVNEDGEPLRSVAKQVGLDFSQVGKIARARRG